MAKTKKFEIFLRETLQDPKDAAAYLNAALEDPDPHIFLIALKDVADAVGGMGKLAEESSLNRESLYRTLSLKGNPKFVNLKTLLEVLGLEIAIHPHRKKKKTRKPHSRRKKRFSSHKTK